jgi:preprotein translocase subunit SecF
MSEHHKFRYLLPPGNTFHFVAKFKSWIFISILLMGASIGALFLNKARHGAYMNWTIDFSGGSEIIFAFKDKAKGTYVKVDPHTLREAFDAAGDKDVEVSEITYAVDTDAGSSTVYGQIVRTARFSAVKPEVEQAAAEAFKAKFADRQIEKAT